MHLSKTGLSLKGYDFITSVPMHPLKLKERGYNQASLLAKYLANYFKIPCKDDIIYETHHRSSQTKLQKLDREKNIKNAFLVKTDMKNKRIILIDDIFTTGATARSCSQALKDKRAQTITVITLAKTPTRN